ncbi:endolysin [Acinetobacter phage vB_AbaM_P1]|nr:endolysin [Acinetobacter phage vB_AbaM_P1]
MKLTEGGFKILRGELFKTLDQKQVDALNFIVKGCDSYKVSYPEAAYILATIFHETGIVVEGKLYRSMQPVKERGSDAYLKSKKYYPYIGYGYVQLTWEPNYKRVGGLIGVDLIKHPEKALEPDIALKIAIEGMLKGWFTGVGFQRKRPVSKYNKAQYTSARAIINGTDKAADIANYAMVFEKALRSY